jgi:hypothetical protein
MGNQDKNMQWHSQLSPEEVTFTTPEVMAKFLATIDEKGYPHITMITSNIALSPDEVKWGEFSFGKSKGNVTKNPKQGMIYMTIQMPFKFLQVKAKLNYISMNGDDAEDFNMMNLLRYNTYLRVYRVFFNNVVGARPIRDIKLTGIVKGIVSTIFGPGGKTGTYDARLKKLGNYLFNGKVFPKFIAYLDPEDGYPIITPVFQARAVEGKRIVIKLTQFKEDLLSIPKNAKVAIFAMDFETVSQLIKGRFLGIENNRGIIDIEEIYNSMPPKMGLIYPKLDTREKITEFI